MLKPDMKVRIGRLELRNPVMAASGTFGSGEEYKDISDLDGIGAIVTKSITLKPRDGNPPPRIIETPSGVLNAIGIQNDGVDAFIKNKLPFLNKVRAAVVVSIAGHSFEDYSAVASRLDRHKRIDAIEVNVSCPNVKGGMEFSRDPILASDVTKAVKRSTGKPIIVKLSPNTGDIAGIAAAVEEAGADAVSLVNTFSAMAVDIEACAPVLGNITGGLSGPAIKPIALRMVWETSKRVKIPVIGMGGIMGYEDALEFIIAGASAIQVGTANFVDPGIAVEIVDGIGKYMRSKKIRKIKEITGCLRT
jgi:dihydroorotate dehydrogenase (NAD+) catalytic subunit